MTLLQQALEALEQLIQEKCDYMLRNKLGNPESEHATKQGRAAITALRAAIEQGVVVMPKEPTDECLHSMAVRYDHGLGMDGYYDNSIFDKSPTPNKHAQRLESTKRTMNQLYEEATGQGFYKLPPAPITQEDGK